MLCLDTALLGDYLDGEEAARAFLRRYDDEAWAVSGVVLYEALMAVVHGHVAGDVATVRQAIAASMDVLDVTERTAVEATAVQRALLDRGAPVAPRDALVAANAREHGATFATAERRFRTEEARDVLDVAVYDPC